MSHKKIFLLIFILLGINCSLSGQVTCPPNIGFEFGNTSIWNFYVGTCCPITTPISTLAIPRRHTLTSGTTIDPHGLFPIVAPGGGSYSLMLGSDTVNNCAEKARYYVHIPSGVNDYSLIYRYACVLQDGGHLPSAQPRFEVNVYDSVTGAAVSCAQYNFVASSTLPGFYTSFMAGYADVYCKSWTTSSINLSGLGGTTVIVDFSAGDCGYGAHFGYGYLDMSCGLFAISTVTCDTNTTTLTGPFGFQSYSWYDSSTFGIVLDTQQTATLPITASPVTYALVLTPYAGYGCQDTLYTHVRPSHLALHKRDDTAVCFGSGPAITLTTGATDISMPLTYSWVAAAGLACTTCADPVARPTSATTYVFTVTDAAGCLRSDSIRITGNIVGNTISVTNVRCYADTNGTATVSVTSGEPPYTYSWSTAPVQTTPTAVHLAAGTYTVNITDTFGCTGVAIATITEPGPTVLSFRAHSNPTTCFGHDGTIRIGGVVGSSTDTLSYTFNGTPASTVITASDTGTIILSGLAAGIYDDFTLVTSGCQYNTIGPLTLTDPATPDSPSVTFQSYCQFDIATSLVASGTNLLWYGRGVSGSSVAPIPGTAIPGTDTFYVTQTVAGCVSSRAMDVVSITTKPAPPLVTDTSYCQYTTVSSLSATGVNLRWYTDTSRAALGGPPVPSTDIVGSTTYYVRQRVNGCMSDFAPLTVNILYKPVFSITQSRPFVCQYDTLSFNYFGPPLSSASYSWILSNGESVVTGNDTSVAIVVSFDSVFNQFVALKASDFSGQCSATDTLKVKILAEPYATSYIKDVICAGQPETIAISSSSDNAQNFIWDFNGANIITGNANSGGPYIISWSAPGLYIVKLSAQTTEGCKGKENDDTVKVLPSPDARIFTYATNKSICMEDSVFFSAMDTTEYGNMYMWMPIQFFHNMNKPQIWGKIEIPGYVTLLVTNPFGCEASDSVLVTPDACCTISFPTGFTPNGDGKNDHFRPIFNGYHNFHEFRIENRWGQMIFESTNSKAEWDGTLNGVPQDIGIYFYYIKYDCGGQTLEAKGNVTLIR